jgi:hypothetical protein
LTKTPLSIREPLNAALGSHREPSLVMSADNSPLAPQRCSSCAQSMKLIRRTQRFGGLSDICIFECEACDVTLIEECKATVRQAGEEYRNQAKACCELATQSRGDDRKFWLGLSDYWLKLAKIDDEHKR